jgi:2-dehydro-3-deoxygalactonokinase
LIALDWGTSNLRASLLGDDGAVLDARAAAGGVMAVPERRFAQALQSLCGDWIGAHRVPLIASGMIGSRQGWREAPYLACPAGLADAAARLTRVDVPSELPSGVVLHIVPGLHVVGPDGLDDVMRGEETQLWGADLGAGRCAILPGTHSKWAWLGEGGQVVAFQTCMTGEVFALLSQHSILGRLMVSGGASPRAFEQGVRLGLAENAQLLHALFANRTAGLMNRLPGEGLADHLSGLLIGAEIGGALRRGVVEPLALIGDEALCGRYEVALSLAGLTSTRVAMGATTRGQWRVAEAAGLVKDPSR